MTTNRGRVFLALGALYFIWGSTYLGIRVALEGFPPLLMAGLRFVCAGALLYGAQRLRGEPNPTRKQWGASALVGLLLCGANSFVCVAEQWVSSGVAAVAIASVPLWAVLFAGLWGRWPARRDWLALAVGLAGVLWLQAGGDLRASPAGAAVLLASTICWALGSVWSRSLPLPKGLMASGAEMLSGGAVILLVALLRGERLTAMPGARPLLAFAFLVVFGSLIAFSAYGFLLANVRPALATSYAYVNPLVAVGLGALFAKESIAPSALGALALILGGVGLLAFGRRETVGQGSA